jgi:hypothetical protein
LCLAVTADHRRHPDLPLSAPEASSGAVSPQDANRKEEAAAEQEQPPTE